MGKQEFERNLKGGETERIEDEDEEEEYSVLNQTIQKGEKE